MSRNAPITERDVVLYAEASPEAIHAAVLQLYQRGKAMLAAMGPSWTDSDGVIHQRRFRLVFGEAERDRSIRQNRFYWGPVLTQISEQAPGRWTVDAWHELFRRQILGYEVVKVDVAGQKRPHTIRRLRSTKDLSVPKMSEYLDAVIAMAVTDLGVVFKLDPREREAVRYVAPKPKGKSKTPEAAEA